MKITMTMKEARAALRAHGVTPKDLIVDIYDAIHDTLDPKYPDADIDEMHDFVDEMTFKVAE